MNTKPLHIALVGFGNIGTGVVRHLAEYASLINHRIPREIVLKTICDKDLETDRGVSIKGIRLTDDYHEIVRDPDIEVVIELVGGTTVAYDIVTASLKAGKHVVTANKALVATYGGDLFRLAAEHNAHLLFEASVGAGIPLIHSMQTGLLPNRFLALHGILNGTCNYILSAMEDHPGTPFETVLKEAMDLGYAEPDPTLDIEGYDTAHKIAIMGSLAYEYDLRARDVVVKGITHITPKDIEFAREHGQTIKLLASARLDKDEQPHLSVWPTFVPANHPIGRVRGVVNTLWIEAEPIGPTMYTGAGAGQGSTGSGILSDVMLIAQAGSAEMLGLLNPLHIPTVAYSEVPPDVLHPKRYLRINDGDKVRLKSALRYPVIEEFDEGMIFSVPEQKDVERKELLGKLHDLGIGESDFCEIHVALQPEDSSLLP